VNSYYAQYFFTAKRKLKYSQFMLYKYRYYWGFSKCNAFWSIAWPRDL